MTETRGAGAGLAYVLAATAVAGAAGYVIQAVVPGFVSAEDYVVFSVFWSAVYLVVSAISGVQQEVARAARPSDGASSGGVIIRFTVGVALVAVAVVAASSPLWAPATLGGYASGLVPAMLVAAAGYSCVAVLSGVFYGARAWRAVAGLTVSDALLRLLCLLALLATGAGLIALGWAVALPFFLAAALVSIVGGHRAVRAVRLDVSAPVLVRNSLSTVGAALATGVMISGLPAILGGTARMLEPGTLASLILVITLTRAPLVIPLLALQSYLVVTFRDEPRRVLRHTLVWGGILLAATAVLAAAGTVVGPWVVESLYAGKYVLAPAAYAGIIASAGLTALLCLTGPAALARGHHGRYVAGWAAASIVMVCALAYSSASEWSVIVPLVLSPVVGAAIHASAIVVRRREAG